MSPEDAKIILQAYRPDGSDAGDAAFAEALQVAKDDPLLGRWFEKQQAFDRAIALKIVSIKPPAGLRASILAAETAEKPSPFWWVQPRWMAVAAGLMVAVVIVALYHPKAARAADDGSFLAFVADDAKHSERHGGRGEAAGALQAALSQPTAHLGDPMPVNFDELRTNGCRSLSFGGRDVLEVCFNRNGTWFHCYIVRHDDFPSLIAQARPEIENLDHYKMAAWTNSAQDFLVVSVAGEAALRRLL
ncbi:MAG TPA: hypothetical protein VGM73_18115 [Candidatus Didemnitutus sp.]|jgi:hypothetical protein